MTPYLADTDLTLYHGDCLDVLGELPEASVQTCVTSPPYWGLRDYGADGQLGLEATPDEYVARLVAVFREVRRVLRDDATLWLNLGDSYAGHNAVGFREGNEAKNGGVSNKNGVGYVAGMKPKDLVGIPWRVAFALQADGWWLRSDIIWSKPNPMPESVTDRPTKAHEYVFLLTKRASYYFDADAVRESAQPRPQPRPEDKVVTPNATAWLDNRYARGASGYGHNPAGRNVRSVWTIATQPYADAHFATFPQELARRCILAGTSEKGCCPECGAPWVRETASAPDPDRPQAKRALEIAEREGLTERHLEALRACGISDVGKALVTTNGTGKNDPAVQALADEARAALKGYAREFLIKGTTQTTGWRPSCACTKLGGAENHAEGTGERIPSAPPDPVPCTVLDPFAGSGTTLLVARNHGRRSIRHRTERGVLRARTRPNAAADARGHMSGETSTAAASRRLSTRRMADLRQAAGMSLRALERQTGISNGLLSLMEHGRLVPDRKQLDALTRALGLPDGWTAHVRIEIEWVPPA